MNAPAELAHLSASVVKVSIATGELYLQGQTHERVFAARKHLGVPLKVEEVLGRWRRVCERLMVPVSVHIVRRRYREKASDAHEAGRTHWTDLESVRDLEAFADVKTGVLYCARTGRCLSTEQLRLIRGVR